MRLAVYPGTFDPVTNGHLDIIKRTANLFDQVIVAVAQDNYKHNLFNLEERLGLLQYVTREIKGVVVESFTGLTMEYARLKGAGAIVRGLRAISDFEYEFQLSMMNKKLAPEVETVFLMTASEYSFISSTMIKQVASLGGCIKGLVPGAVEDELINRFNRKQE